METEGSTSRWRKTRPSALHDTHFACSDIHSASMAGACGHCSMCSRSLTFFPSGFSLNASNPLERDPITHCLTIQFLAILEQGL